MNSLSDVILNKLANTVRLQTIKFNSAMKSIREGLLTVNTTTLVQLNQNKLENYMNVLNCLLNIQNYFIELMNTIRLQIFSLISTVIDGYNGFITPLFSTVSGILHQIAGCGSCLDRDFVSQSKYHNSQAQKN